MAMDCARQPHLGALDFTVIIAYFVIVLAVGFWSMFKVNRSTISGYFLAGRFMSWLPVGASLFATNIGSEHFIGLAGSGAAGGIGVGGFEMNALVILQLLGWVFLPVYIASGVHTLPEFMSKRFGGQRIRVYLAVLSLILYVLTKMSVNIYSGSLFIQELLGWNLWVSIAVVLGMTAVCTITGGLAAVMYMDTFQCLLMVSGATVLSVLAFNEVGGYSSMIDSYMVSKATDTAWNATCGLASPKSMTMLRDVTDPDYPWLGYIFGQTPASIWYWAADQMMVQRALASKSLTHAQGATLFAGLLKITPLFLIVMPGMISRVLCPDSIACVSDCASHCGNAVSCSNLAYPKLVIGLMPNGLRGIMLAGMLAALMSDLTSLFNSAATLFSLDIWNRIRPKATPNEQLIVGRVWVLVMVALAVGWVPIIGEKQGGQLYLYIQSIAADLAPPIGAVYLLAILWKRTNETGAFYGLVIGFCVGSVRMCFEFAYGAPGCGETDLRPFFVRVHYMYFAMCLFVVSIMSTVLISLFTHPLPQWRLYRTTYWTRFSVGSRPDEDNQNDDDYEMLKLNPTDETNSVELHPLNVIPNDGNGAEGKTAGLDSCLALPASQRCTRCFLWLLGFQKESDLEHTKTQQHLITIKSLDQTQREKLLLNCGLVCILTITVSLYVYFSFFTDVDMTNYPPRGEGSCSRACQKMRGTQSL